MRARSRVQGARRAPARLGGFRDGREGCVGRSQAVRPGDFDRYVDPQRLAKETKMTKTLKKQKSERWAIVGHGPYGLSYGLVKDDDAKIVADKSVRLYRARNIRLWYGKRGGITSLAAFGPWGPKKQDRRGGAGVRALLLL